MRSIVTYKEKPHAKSLSTRRLFSFRAFVVTCVLAFSLNLTAQQANCIDLSDLHAHYIHCTWGNCDNPYLHSGIKEGRHTVITQQGTDSNTGDSLKMIPEGET